MARRLIPLQLLLALILRGACLHAQQPDAPDDGPGSWAAADARALSAPESLRSDPPALATFLTRGARSDTERARAIFRWITEHIAYDYDAMGRQDAVRPEDVLLQGRSVCEGYASAFEMLGRMAGLEVVTIHGYAKGYDYRPGGHFDRPNHAWNAVRIGGIWRLIDSTWGAGYVRDGHFVKELEDYFFMPAPEALAFTHLPEDPQWALVPHPLTLARFEAQPVARAEFFRAGFSAADASAALREPGASALVEVFKTPDLGIAFTTAPAGHTLAAGQRYRFEVTAPPGTRIAVVNGGRWSYLQRRTGSLSGTLIPRRGDLLVLGGSGSRMHTLLRYEAR